MAWSSYHFFLAGLMLFTGSINTLTTKWADVESAPGAPRWGDSTRLFYHPFVQACAMFIGEFACFISFKILVSYKKHRSQPMDVGPQQFSPLVMLPPALCDMCATSLMYMGKRDDKVNKGLWEVSSAIAMGVSQFPLPITCIPHREGCLALTFASSFQMLRGSVIIFTGLLSVAFLGKKLKFYEWLGMFTVLAGLIVVGVTDIIDERDLGTKDINGIITGDLLIIMAQIITATQMVVEEKFLKQHDIPPLQAVGWEGVFGFSVLAVLLIPFYYIPAGQISPVDLADYPLEDTIDAFWQMHYNKLIWIATLGTIISIAFFNFAGLSVTREMNATTRMVLDSLRTLTVWFFSVFVGWETFHPLLILGFGLLLLGTFIYNDALFAPLLRYYGVLSTSTATEREPLVTPVRDDTVPSPTGLIN